MGKKGSTRRTRWKALPLSGEDGASGSEDDVSTCSSGRGPGLVLRMRDHSYRHTRRALDRDRSREPLVKLESKTFDEEEYTKITTPRQDVLLKKGYLGRRKLESSIEEGVHITHEGEVEEAPMEQMIITNGFVDERGHYLVNGTSYEIYDPYTNTVTVVVGPPPYANGVTPPVLAAVSCQPVPLQPVDWYPPTPGQGDWPPGPAWTPAYPKGPAEPPEGETPNVTAQGESPIYPQPFLFQNLIYPVPIGLNGVPEAPLEQEAEETSDQQKEDFPPDSEQDICSGEETQAPPTVLKPPAEEFVPCTVLKPSTKEFIPASALKPPTTEFVPQALKQNGSALAPADSHEFIPPTPPPPPSVANPVAPSQASPQETTISNQSSEKNINNTAAPLPTAEIAVKSSPSLDESTNISQLKQDPSTPDSIQVSKTTTNSKENATLGKPIMNSLNLEEVINSPKRESHGTQTPPELDSPLPKNSNISTPRKSPPLSPRRSYAKTVCNGLDLRPTIEPIINGKNNQNAKEIISNKRDNKNIIQNGTILTNGHDVTDRLTNNREQSKNVRNSRDGKKYSNGQDKEIITESNEQRKPSWQNGKDKLVRKDGKEIKRHVNGYEQHNGKNKEGVQNGFHNGKEKLVNGKSSASQKPKVDVSKRPSQLQIPSDTDSKSTTSPDDSDEQFRPVENRRNRAAHNGYSRNKLSPQIRPETEKEIVVDVKSPMKENVEAKINGRNNEKPVESDKSSTISELSSPTELSSGQTTPPDCVTPVQQVETQEDLNKSAEKLREGLEEKKPRKSQRKGRKNAARRVEVKEPKEDEIFEEPPPLPEFLQPPRDELTDLNLDDALDHILLRSLQKESAITKVNLFPARPPIFPGDLFTRTNLSHMRATKPEELFASIVETPSTPTEVLRTNEKPRKVDKSFKPSHDVRSSMRKTISTAYKPSKKPLKEEQEVENATNDVKDDKVESPLGIVDAVKTWLESQDGAALSPEEVAVEAPPESPEPKNVICNPLPAPSAEGSDGASGRVADATPDLASLTDARASVEKYYSLSVRRMSKTSETSDLSEQEAVDALEYAFPRPPGLAAHTANFPTKDLACKLQ